MGLFCTCGVLIPTPLTAEGTVEFLFSEDNTTVEGMGTYTADACADRLEAGSVTFNFMDTDNTTPDRSFLFASTSITQVSCEILGEICLVTVRGIGMIAGDNVTRGFRVTFVDRPAPFEDTVRDFIIDGFGSQSQDEILPEEITTFCFV